MKSYEFVIDAHEMWINLYDKPLSPWNDSNVFEQQKPLAKRHKRPWEKKWDSTNIRCSPIWDDPRHYFKPVMARDVALPHGNAEPKRLNVAQSCWIHACTSSSCTCSLTLPSVQFGNSKSLSSCHVLIQVYVQLQRQDIEQNTQSRLATCQPRSYYENCSNDARNCKPGSHNIYIYIILCIIYIYMYVHVYIHIYIYIIHIYYNIMYHIIYNI